MLNQKIQQCFSLLLMISIARLLFLLGLIGLSNPHFGDFIFITIGILAHLKVSRYFGYSILNFKRIAKEDDFIPLERWMVANNEGELSGEDYKILLDEFDLSVMAKQKLETIGRDYGKITYFDALNIVMYEDQYGKPEQRNLNDNNLKKIFKSRFK